MVNVIVDDQNVYVRKIELNNIRVQ